MTRGQKGARGDAPGALEDFGQDEHRHVAAHAVALPRDALQLAEQRVLQRGIAVVELQRVGPAREVRVAPVGEDAFAPQSNAR